MSRARRIGTCSRLLLEPVRIRRSDLEECARFILFPADVTLAVGFFSNGCVVLLNETSMFDGLNPLRIILVTR